MELQSLVVMMVILVALTCIIAPLLLAICTLGFMAWILQRFAGNVKQKNPWLVMLGILLFGLFVTATVVDLYIPFVTSTAEWLLNSQALQTILLKQG